MLLDKNTPIDRCSTFVLITMLRNCYSIKKTSYIFILNLYSLLPQQNLVHIISTNFFTGNHKTGFQPDLEVLGLIPQTLQLAGIHPILQQLQTPLLRLASAL